MYAGSGKNILAPVITTIWSLVPIALNVVSAYSCNAYSFDCRSKEATSHGQSNPIRTSMPTELGMGMGGSPGKKALESYYSYLNLAVLQA